MHKVLESNFKLIRLAGDNCLGKKVRDFDAKHVVHLNLYRINKIYNCNFFLSIMHTSVYRQHEDTHTLSLDDWLTMHRSITLVNFQLDAQNSLFIYR